MIKNWVSVTLWEPFLWVLTLSHGFSPHKSLECLRAGAIGGTAMTPASSSESAPLKRARFSASARIAKSETLLNSAAPQNTRACPPVSRQRTRCAAIEERTLSIGFGIKGASQEDRVATALNFPASAQGA